MTPATVISNPDDHQLRSVNSDLAAPTAKWAISDRAKATTTAVKPPRKKKGITGIMAPTPVLRKPAKAAARQARGQDEPRRGAGGPGYAGHDAEHRRQAVVGAVDGVRHPPARGAVPGLAAEEALEAAVGDRLHVSRLAGGRRRHHLVHRQGVRALVLPDRPQQLVRLEVAGRLAVHPEHLVVLGRLAGSEHPIDRGQLGLQAEPQ